MPRPFLILASLLASGAQAATLSFKDSVKPLLETHCVECHGEETHKAGLRLDNLAPDFNDPAWIHVLDKMQVGEMPPKKRERPPAGEMKAATQFLHEQLHAASLDLQQKKGRVIVRRLNGTEYENTLHDLLGTQVPLKELLPEDNSVAGFDNISTALDLSASHLLMYQEAAERAVASVVPLHPNLPFTDSRTGLDMTKKGPNFNQGLSRTCKLQGDSLIIYTKLPRYGLCCTAPILASGRYRVSMSACAVGEGVKSIPAAYMTVEQSGREPPVLHEVHDVPAGEPKVIEFEFNLNRHQSFVVNLLTNWDIRGFKKPIEEYTGPGLRVDWLKVEGPLDDFPGTAYHTLFGDLPLEPRSVAKAKNEGARLPTIPADRKEASWFADPLVPVSEHPKEDAERLIRAFLPRAFRHPVEEAVKQQFVKRVHAKLDQKATFYEAMMYGFKLILSSPDFLFLADAGPVDAKGDLVSPRLDPYSLACRLSYFLWSTQPDFELLQAAHQGRLNKPEELHAQVERLLQSPKAQAFTKNFAGQWLDLRKIDATIPDPQLYSDFDNLLLWSMPQETERFFEEVLHKDMSLLEFVNSDWTMLNERLAELYGIPGIEGSTFHKVKVPPGCHRGGVMTQAAVMKVTADGTRTSPVLRGKWVLERIVGKPPSPPPPDVPAIEPDIRGATTIRQQLDKHRNVPACATCHIHIDPPGFALETFDPIGNWREFYRVTTRTKAGIAKTPYAGGRAIYRGPDVELGGQTPEGKAFKDIDDYKQLLLQDKDQLARSLCQKLLVYSTGADLQFADREVVEQIVARVRAKNYGFRSLVHEVVQSRVFLDK